jgi:glutamate-ammonia-ligase adenylyltransferase
MGGLELSYASDLDLVFLYGGVNDTVMTDGPAPIPSAQFFARVGRRMINILTTNMLGGALYEVDLRLRPSGNSGLLVSSVEAYEAYQLNSAWTWEQQALVRARFVAGDAEIGEAFRLIRRRSLGRPRDEESLRREVQDMREKMRENLAAKDPGGFDLKQGPGGIADIEFIVQFKVLSGAHAQERLLQWSDVVRLLDCLQECELLGSADAELLRKAYCVYRERTHRAALLDLPALVPDSEYTLIRSSVVRVWRSTFTPEEIT